METRGILPASVDKASEFKMVDIGEKKDTQRRALASGYFYAAQDTILRIRNRTLPKGDVLTLCEVAGIQGAKFTSSLLPLCHPLSLTSVRVWSELSENHIQVFCETKTFGKTGVEMEALCAVNAALLCIYDLTKGIDPVLRIGDIRLEIKEGGKSGYWENPEIKKSDLVHCLQAKVDLSKIIAAVIVLSDRCSKNNAQDVSGDVAKKWLMNCGAIVVKSLIIPDEKKQLYSELQELLKHNAPNLIITSGGTGLSKRDITPDVVTSLSKELGGREIQGFGERLRLDGSKVTPHAWLSRSTAVLIQNTLIICLPGNPGAVKEGLDSIGDLIKHTLHIASGGGH